MSHLSLFRDGAPGAKWSDVPPVRTVQDRASASWSSFPSTPPAHVPGGSARGLARWMVAVERRREARAIGDADEEALVVTGRGPGEEDRVCSLPEIFVDHGA